MGKEAACVSQKLTLGHPTLKGKRSLREQAVGAMGPNPRNALQGLQEAFVFQFLACGHDLVQEGECWVGKLHVDSSSNDQAKDRRRGLQSPAGGGD